jgi:hypothetical protein
MNRQTDAEIIKLLTRSQEGPQRMPSSAFLLGMFLRLHTRNDSIIVDYRKAYCIDFLGTKDTKVVLLHRHQAKSSMRLKRGIELRWTTHLAGRHVQAVINDRPTPGWRCSSRVVSLLPDIDSYKSKIGRQVPKIIE